MGAVAGGVVGESVLPAAPDDVCPAAGEDAFGVGVALAVGAQLPVAGLGPGVAVPAVACEVAEGVTELLVAAEAEGDRTVTTACPGRWGDAGEAGEGLGVGEPGPTVADLGEKRGGSDGGAAGQGPEDVGVRVGGEEFIEAGRELVDLGPEALEDGDVGEGDGAARVAVVAGVPVGRAKKAGVQLGWALSAAVAVGTEPGAEALLGQPGGTGGRGEPFEESK